SKIGGTDHRLWWPVLSCGLSLRSDALQQPCQKSPERPHRRNLQPLAGAVHVHNMRSERNQLHARVLFADYAALQPRVHGYQFGNLAQNLLMHRLAFAHDIAGRFGLPPRIAAAVLHLKVRHPEDGGHHAAGSQFAALDGLRWLVSISTSPSFVDTMARLVDVCTNPATSGLIARTPWCWLASSPTIALPSASSTTCS